MACWSVSENLDVGQPRGIVDGNMDQFVADARGAALLPVAGDAAADPAERNKLLDVDVNQVCRYLALVALHRRLGVQISQPPEARSARRAMVCVCMGREVSVGR